MYFEQNVRLIKANCSNPIGNSDRIDIMSIYLLNSQFHLKSRIRRF